jgi:hypothetical protein
MRIASFQRRVRFLFHAWRVTFNPIYIETLHLQYFSPSIICIEHDEEEEGEKLIDRKGDIFFSLYQIKPKNKV